LTPLNYKELGRSGIKASVYGLGVMTFGGQTPEDDAMRQLDMAHDAGVNLFDTAESYPTPASAETQGRSEEILGRWIASRKVRGKAVIATKVTGPGDVAGDVSYIRGKSRKLDRANIREAVEGSLRRLGVDCIDLYQVHWAERAISTIGRSRYSQLPDDPKQVPIEETMGALGELVTEGKVRAIGVCNETPWGMMHYLQAAEQKGLPRPVSMQNSYSLLDRYYELGCAEFAIREGLGLLAYSPLASGTLTGKYASKTAIPGSRSSESPVFLSRLLTDNRQRAITAYAEIARAHGLEPAHMALAFIAQQPFTASVLMAASSAKQLESNLGAISVSLSKDVVQAINAIHDTNPNPK
jgi:aryl-alcohol dehydrogenase-like predicted oxidoreductase